MEPTADIALIGLAVMGQNLILNMNDHGYSVVAFNRTLARVDEFLAKEAKGTNVRGAHSIEEMVGLLKKPRRVMLMVKAGKPVDEFIEQLIPRLEPGDIIKHGLARTADEMHSVFKEWNEGELESYLIEITRDILAFKDTDGQPLVENILDTAGQKGTGKWTVQSSADLGIPITLIAEAVYARCVSALKDERVKAAKKLKGPRPALAQAKKPDPKKQFINDIRDALYSSKIVSYAQGYMLMRAAAAEYNWNLNYGGIALMWRGGCIIRSRFLGKIKEAFDKNPKLAQLMLDDYFRGEIKRCQKGWRNVVAAAMKRGIAVPAFSTALAFYDQYRAAVLPANLLQAQRAYFGAHTYERIDKPRGEFFHTNWTGRGGAVSSSTYSL